MKILAMGFLVIVCIAVGFFAMKSHRVKNYLISSLVKRGTWVTIEYGNPKCPPVAEGRLSRDIPIPADGYLCTSSPIYRQWAFYRYYLVDANGHRSQLLVDKDISLESTLDLNPLNPNCKVREVESFWYGSKDQASGDAFAAIKKAHPECDEAIRISP